MSRSVLGAARMFLVMFTFLLLVPVTVGAQAAGWFAPEWSMRRAVTIANPTGQVLTTHQVLVRLDASFDFSKALSNGGDLRVTDGNGTTLIPFWIESWNAAARTASIWVRVTTIPLTGTTIYLYYGNPAPPAPVVGPQPPIGPFAKHPANPMDVTNAPYGVNNLLTENLVFTGGKYWSSFATGASPRT